MHFVETDSNDLQLGSCQILEQHFDAIFVNVDKVLDKRWVKISIMMTLLMMADVCVISHKLKARNLQNCGFVRFFFDVTKHTETSN